MCKNVPETVQWIQKVRILWKNGLNFKLKHRNAQKSILSGRFGALTGRPGDVMKNLETLGKTGRVGRYEGSSFIVQFDKAQNKKERSLPMGVVKEW